MVHTTWVASRSSGRAARVGRTAAKAAAAEGSRRRAARCQRSRTPAKSAASATVTTPAMRGADGAGDEHRGARHREAVGGGAVVEADIVDADRPVEPGGELHQHAGRGDGLDEDAVHRVAEQELQPEGDAPRRAADPAGQVDHQGMRGIDRDAGRRQLALQVEGRRGVAEEQVHRALVIDEMRVRPAREGVPRRRDRAAVIARMLHHPGADVAQALLLPGLGVVGHVDLDLEAEGAGHHPDAEAEIAGAAHRHGEGAEGRPDLRARPGGHRIRPRAASPAARASRSAVTSTS